jgi:hypothetical protein
MIMPLAQIAALHGLLVDERLLQWMQFVEGAEPLQRGSACPSSQAKTDAFRARYFSGTIAVTSTSTIMPGQAS